MEINKTNKSKNCKLKNVCDCIRPKNLLLSSVITHHQYVLTCEHRPLSGIIKKLTNRLISENSAYLFKKTKKPTKKQKNICRHVFSCPAMPTAFSASRGFCAPGACASVCACCSARKGLAVMALWPWFWAPGSRLLMGN